MEVGERIRAEFEATSGEGSGAGPQTLSIGVACTADLEAPTAHGLVRAADQALYGAKRHGRNRVLGHRAIDDEAPTLVP